MGEIMKKEEFSKLEKFNVKSETDLAPLYTLLDKEFDSSFIEPLLKIFENNPEFGFGSPGKIVHYIERFPSESYIDLLYASIKRFPTEYNLWMLNRYLNTVENEKKITGISILKEVYNNASSNFIKELAQGFLETQGINTD